MTQLYASPRLRSDLRELRARQRAERPAERQQQTPFQQLLSLRSGALATSPRVVPVSEKLALTLSAVFCSVRVQADAKASLPLKVYERKGPGQQDAEVTMHPVAELLRVAPTPETTPVVWKSVRQAHLALWGNAYAELQFDGRGNITAAWPLHPATVEAGHATAEIDPKTGRQRLVFRVDDEQGVRIIDADQMLHTPGLSLNGIDGLSVIRYGSGSMSVGLAADKLVATFIDHGAKPSIVVTTPEYLGDEQFARLQRELNTEYSGDKAFGALLLEGGATFSAGTMPFADVQLLETRKFQGEEIAARWFGLPPHLAGFLENAHYNNLSEQDRAFVIHCLMPWMIRDEEEMNRKLFRGDERGRFYVKHNAEALLRGDTKSRYEAHASSIRSGWKTRNEVRRDEDLPPLPGGDELPSPAAIWGKGAADAAAGGGAAGDSGDGQGDKETEGQGDTPPRPKPKRRRSRPSTLDPRLSTLVQRTLDGLLQTERIQAGRSAGDTDKIDRFYEQHQRRLVERLDGLVSRAALTDYCERHRAQLRHAAADADPAAATTLALETWAADAAALAATLSSP